MTQPQTNPLSSIPEIPLVPSQSPTSDEPPLADSPQRLPSPPEANLEGNDVMMIEVFVPDAEARVFILGNPTKQTGVTRLYSSPAVAKGQRYQYEIRAEWEVRGEKIVRTRVVTGIPGDRLTADFR